jgi:hypothetical protein
MATKPTKPLDTNHYAPAETLVLDDLPVMETVEFRRFASKKSDDTGNDEEIDSLGIGSMTVADLKEILEDDIPTDEMPIMQEDDTFV